MKQFNLILLFFLFTVTVDAQINVSSTSSDPNSKWVYGGYAGLGFTSGSFSLYTSPSLGYKVNKDFVIGLEGDLSWNKSDYSRHISFGIGPFLRYFIGRQFYASAAYRYYFINQKVENKSYNLNEATLNLGAGYLQPLGEKAYLQIGVNYNVLYDKDNSVMASPFVPYVGVVFGI